MKRRPVPVRTQYERLLGAKAKRKAAEAAARTKERALVRGPLAARH